MTSCGDRIRNQIRKPIRLFVSHKLNGEVTKKIKTAKGSWNPARGGASP